MIGYVMVGTNNLDKAIIFYDEVLRILNLQRKDTDEVCAGYCQKDGDGSIDFMLQNLLIKKLQHLEMELRFLLLFLPEK